MWFPPLLNEHPGSQMLAGGARDSDSGECASWLNLEDGGPPGHFLEFGCCSSLCAPTPQPSVRDTGVKPPLGSVRFFLTSKTVRQKGRQ